MLFLFSGGDSKPFCWILAELSFNYCPHSEEGKEERLLQNNGLTLSPKSRDSQTKPRLFASRLCITKAKYFLFKFIKKIFHKSSAFEGTIQREFQITGQCEANRARSKNFSCNSATVTTRPTWTRVKFPKRATPCLTH